MNKGKTTPAGRKVVAPGKRAEEKLTVKPGATPGTVTMGSGEQVRVPDGWALVEPGDATVTRRVKAGPHWLVQVRRRNRNVSVGVWAPASRIARVQREVAAMRQTTAHKKQLASGRARREREQVAYVDDFTQAIQTFLDFHTLHADLGKQLAVVVAAHATPVGSGTVARTKRISIERRAEAAVIAWMRHQTTAYDHMAIRRQKGARREVRRKLAQQSRNLLEKYRKGRELDPTCPLYRALQSAPSPAPEVTPGTESPTANTSASTPPLARPRLPPLKKSTAGAGIRGILARKVKK